MDATRAAGGAHPQSAIRNRLVGLTADADSGRFSATMSAKRIEKVTVVGVGLLGGSIGLAAKAADERIRVVGVGRRMSSLQRALDAGAVDEATLDTAAGVAAADVVVLAAPMAVYARRLQAAAPHLRRGAMVTDVGSTKRLVVGISEKILGLGGPFVGSHPMAGGERQGPDYARADLFVGATCIVTPTSKTPAALTRRAERFWEMLGGVTARMSPAAHDRAVARVSHLPHLLASLMVRLQRVADLPLAGTGWLDTTRVASGSPAMWREIIMTNRRAVLSALDAADEGIMRLRDLVEAGDAEAIERYLAAAKNRRDQLLSERLHRSQ